MATAIRIYDEDGCMDLEAAMLATEINDRLRKHKIMPEELRARMPALYSNEGKGKAAMVLLKVFDPCGRGTWYITELDQEDGTCFGYVVSPLGPGCDELGTSNLWEMGSTRNRMGLPLERDCRWKACTLGQVMSGERR
jgi:hypothetical protein